MRDFLRKLFGLSPPVRRTLSEQELERIRHLTEANGEKWSEFVRDIAKWIFATLIALGTGGIYLVLTLGLNPGVTAATVTKLFCALGVALIGAVFMLFGISEKLDFADRILRSPRPKDEIIEEFDIERFLSPKSNLFGPFFFAVLSFGLIGWAGGGLAENITPCSAKDLEYSIAEGENVAPTRQNAKICYFYEIDGLSNDPLERAKQELHLVKELRSKGEQTRIEASKRP
jgi:hypothetical protein